MSAKHRYKVEKDDCGNIILTHCGITKSYRLIELNQGKNYMVVSFNGEQVKLTPENTINQFNVIDYIDCFCVATPVTLEGDVNVPKFAGYTIDFCDTEGNEVCVEVCIDKGVKTWTNAITQAPISAATIATYTKCKEKEYACGGTILCFEEGEVITLDSLLLLAQTIELNDGSIGGVEGINSINIFGNTKLSKWTVNDNPKPFGAGDNYNPTTTTGTPLYPQTITVVSGQITLGFDFYKCK